MTTRKRKSSRMGKVLLVFNTPLSAVRFFDNKELETMNLICLIFQLGIILFRYVKI